MATREEALMELYKRGKLDPQKAAAVEEMVRRGMLQEEQMAQTAATRDVISETTPSFSGRVSEAITGRGRVTPEIAGLPEFRETEEIQEFAPRGIGQQLKLTAGLLSSFSPEAQMDVIKENIPEAEFQKDDQGNIIVDIGGKRSVLNRPGFSGQDAVQALTSILSFVPAGKLASLGTATLTKMGLGGLGAAATEQATQEVSRLAGSEEERDLKRTALAGALGAGAEAIGPAREALRSRRIAKGLGAEAEEVAPALESIAAAEAAEEATGIPLFKAQKTGIPSELEKQSFVAQLPAGTQRAMKSLTKQNVAVGEAVESFLNQLAPPEALTTGAARFRTAAQKALDARSAIRKEKTSPLYKAAFENKSPVDVAPVKTLIKEKLVDLPKTGEMSKTLKKVDGLLPESPNLKQLHNAKVEIDQMLSKVGDGSLGNITKRELVDVKNQLLETMDDLSPEYRTARQAFAEASPSVTALEDSIIGKAAAFDDVNLKRLSRSIFDPAETNAKIISDAKKVIDDVDPEAWNQLLRTELEGRIGTMVDDISERVGSVENAPGMLYRAVFGNPKQRALLYKAVEGEPRKNLKYLETALGRARLGRPGGSQTAVREEIKRELRGGPIQSVRNLLRSPIDTLVSTGDDAAFNKRVRSLSEAMFNPEYKAEMAKIRKMSPTSAASAKALTQLVKNIEKEGE